MTATMANLWVFSLTSFLTTFILCFFFIRFHHLHSIGSRSDKRRHNERPIPLLGGAAIVTGFTVSAIAMVALGNTEIHASSLLYVLAALLTAGVIGVIDDAMELRARWKFIGHNLVTLFMVLAIDGFETPPERLLGTNSLAAKALEWFWCLGILNSINLIDGLDELASGLGLLILSFLTIVASAGMPLQAPLLLIAIPALLGFYLWNRHPARIYLGETGAQAVGIFLFLAAMSFKYASPGADTVALFFSMGVPILDTLLAISRRVSRGTGLMVADREHLHHRLGRLGLSHPNISRFLHFLTVYLCGIAYCFLQLGELKPWALVLALAGLGINLFLLRKAEQKLYAYLANFASHMLRTIDVSNDSVSLSMRRRMLAETGSPTIAFRLDLKLCVGNLLEKSPGRIQSFYSKLGDALRGAPGAREVHFENSRTAIILQVLKPGEDDPARLAFSLRADLERFEERERIDLGLHLSDSIRVLPDNMPAEDNKVAAISSAIA